MDHRMDAYASILHPSDKNLRIWSHTDSRVPRDNRMSYWHIRDCAYSLLHRISPRKNISHALHWLDPPSRIICLSNGGIIRNARRTPIYARVLDHIQHSGNRVQATLVAFSAPLYWLSPTNREVFWRRLKTGAEQGGPGYPPQGVGSPDP